MDEIDESSVSVELTYINLGLSFHLTPLPCIHSPIIVRSFQSVISERVIIIVVVETVTGRECL